MPPQESDGCKDASSTAPSSGQQQTLQTCNTSH